MKSRASRRSKKGSPTCAATPTVSGATPTDVAGQPAYTVRISPKEGGSLFGGAELSFDAVNGVPLRAAIYSSTSSSPVIELAATEVSYGPVEARCSRSRRRAGAKIDEVKLARTPNSSAARTRRPKRTSPSDHPRPRAHGDRRASKHSVKAGAGTSASGSLEGLPRSRSTASTPASCAPSSAPLLSFERSGVRYVLAGSVTPAAIEAFARGL